MPNRNPAAKSESYQPPADTVRIATLESYGASVWKNAPCGEYTLSHFREKEPLRPAHGFLISVNVDTGNGHIEMREERESEVCREQRVRWWLGEMSESRFVALCQGLGIERVKPTEPTNAP